jgi:hypothetical protein
VLKVYQIHGDPYQEEDDTWHVTMMWFDEESGNMGKGTINLPAAHHGYALQKRFRTNITPMDNDDLEMFYDEVTKGMIH